MTQMGAPEVSVVIPTRDRWRFLARSLASALDQHDVALEVVVVDDGSRDEPPADIADLGDRRVVVVRNETSRGVSGARNLGIERARGDWVAFLDDDDLWAPAKLREQLDRANGAATGFVYSSAVTVDEALEPLRLVRAPPADELRARIGVQNLMPAGQSNVIVRRDLIRRLGGFDERLSMIADWEMWIRLTAAGVPQPCPGVHVAYVLHGASMHLVDRRSRWEFDRVASLHLEDRGTRRAAQIFGAKWRADAHRRAGDRVRAAREYLRAGVAYTSPGMVVRGVAVLGGEHVMALGRRAPELPAEADVAWLTDARCMSR